MLWLDNKKKRKHIPEEEVAKNEELFDH